MLQGCKAVCWVLIEDCLLNIFMFVQHFSAKTEVPLFLVERTRRCPSPFLNRKTANHGALRRKWSNQATPTMPNQSQWIQFSQKPLYYIQADSPYIEIRFGDSPSDCIRSTVFIRISGLGTLFDVGAYSIKYGTRSDCHMLRIFILWSRFIVWYKNTTVLSGFNKSYVTDMSDRVSEKNATLEIENIIIHRWRNIIVKHKICSSREYKIASNSIKENKLHNNFSNLTMGNNNRWISKGCVFFETPVDTVL